ncbi:MAG: type II toxin-antitoxin system VapB family antitoxin [Pseudonocardiaceae bacterium]
MTKRLVDVDDELLVAAQRISGENTIKGTVQRALELLISHGSQRETELRRRWEGMGDALADLQDDAVMRQAWS